MSLSVVNDRRRPDGGHAILEGAGLAGLTRVAVRNCFSGQFLGGDGRWGKAPFLCPVVPCEGRGDAIELGPHIVDFIQTDLQVAFQDAAGTQLGRLFWSDIPPSRNPGRVTSLDVLASGPDADASKGNENHEVVDPDASAGQDAASKDSVAEDERGKDAASKDAVPEDAVSKDAVDGTEADKYDAHLDDASVGKKRENEWLLPWRRTAIALLTILLVGGGLAIGLWFRPGPSPQPVAPPHKNEGRATDADITHPHEARPPDDVAPPRPPEPPRLESACSSSAPDALEQGLQKSTSDDPADLYEAERLLICARDGGVAIARAKLGRLYVKMATAIEGSYGEKRAFYKKACAEGDQEGCDKADFNLNR